MKRAISVVVIFIGIILFIVGLSIKIPGTELTTFSILDGRDNYSAIKEYVGGDAYNYIIGASLVGGRISGVFAMKAIFISVGILIFCAGLICLSFVKKEDNQLASLQTNASQEEQSTELNCSNLEISEISNNT